MDLRNHSERDDNGEVEDPLGGGRHSVVRLLTPEGHHRVDKVTEALDNIVLELQDLFKILLPYMNERHDLIRSLSRQHENLMLTRTRLRRVIEAGTYSFFGFTYATNSAKTGHARLSPTEEAFQVHEALLNFLKAPIRTHIAKKEHLKQYQQFSHLAEGLDRMAAIIAKINLHVHAAQVDFDRMHPINTTTRVKRKGVVIPLADFKKRGRRVNSMEQVWHDAYLRSVMAMHEPDCRRDISEDTPIWSMYDAWTDPWHESRK